MKKPMVKPWASFFSGSDDCSGQVVWEVRELERICFGRGGEWWLLCPQGAYAPRLPLHTIGVTSMRYLSACILLIAVTDIHADEELPLPRRTGLKPVPPIASQYLPYYLPSSLPRAGTREVWQYYGVDSRGRWLPRVILAPSGAYRYHNG